MNDNGDEVLPYVFLPDAVRRRTPQAQANSLDMGVLERLLSTAEAEIASGEPSTRDLIVTGLLTELEDSWLWPMIADNLGSKSKQVLVKFRVWKPT